MKRAWLILVCLIVPLFSALAADVATRLTLQQALELARAQRPLMRLAQAEVMVSNATVGRLRAPLLPQLQAGVGYRHASSIWGATPSTLSGVTAPVQRTPSNFGVASASIYASQLVFDFNKSWNNFRGAQALAHASHNRTFVVGLDIDYEVRTAFFRTLAALARLQVEEDNVANEHKHLTLVGGYIQLGTRAPIDLAQARNTFANAKLRLVEAIKNYEQAKVALNEAMGVETAIDYQPTFTQLAPIVSEEHAHEVLLEQALAERPEFARLAALRRSRELSIKAARGGYGPSISLRANAGEAGPTPASAFWSAEAALSWDLYSGGITQAQVAQARGEQAMLEAELTALRQQVRFEVERQSLAVRASKQAQVSVEEVVASAADQLRFAEARYGADLGSIIELENAQRAVTAAAIARVDIELRLSIARAALLRALGRSG